MSAPEIVDLKGCARCHGDHDGIVFRPLTFPVEIPGALVMTTWAECPVNGEPILRGFVERGQQ